MELQLNNEEQSVDSTKAPKNDMGGVLRKTPSKLGNVQRIKSCSTIWKTLVRRSNSRSVISNGGKKQLLVNQGQRKTRNTAYSGWTRIWRGHVTPVVETGQPGIVRNSSWGPERIGRKNGNSPRRPASWLRCLKKANLWEAWLSPALPTAGSLEVDWTGERHSVWGPPTERRGRLSPKPPEPAPSNKT